MAPSSCLFLCIVFCLLTQNLMGRYLLIQLDEKAENGGGMSELLNCMRAEGSPDSCIKFFTTGKGKEICMKELMKKMMKHVDAWDLNWGKCSNKQALKRISPKEIGKLCDNCCMFPVLTNACKTICKTCGRDVRPDF